MFSAHNYNVYRKDRSLTKYVEKHLIKGLNEIPELISKPLFPSIDLRLIIKSLNVAMQSLYPYPLPPKAAKFDVDVSDPSSLLYLSKKKYPESSQNIIKRNICRKCTNFALFT